MTVTMIRRYRNGRFYNITKSCGISKKDLKTLVMTGGQDVIVYDADTKADLGVELAREFFQGRK